MVFDRRSREGNRVGYGRNGSSAGVTQLLNCVKLQAIGQLECLGNRIDGCTVPVPEDRAEVACAAKQPALRAYPPGTSDL